MQDQLTAYLDDVENITMDKAVRWYNLLKDVAGVHKQPVLELASELCDALHLPRSQYLPEAVDMVLVLARSAVRVFDCLNFSFRG